MMIVRILHEGQFEISGAALDELNGVDNQIVEAIADGDEKRFQKLMEQMHELVHAKGTALAMDVFKESDFILPPPDSSMEDVQELFTGEGLIPG
jgi:hypothetical protein